MDSDERRKQSDEKREWTPETVAAVIERMVLHSAHLIRRARWFCLLSESSLAWATVDQPGKFKTLIVLENGSIVKRKIVKITEKPAVPPGIGKSFRTRQNNLDLLAYDRMRVVTTELRRLVAEDRMIEIRVGAEAILDRQKVMKALKWV